jgi:hypothetical protein
MRRPQPPRRARRLLAPIASPPVSGFITYGRLAAPTLHNEAESGSLALRLTSSPREASPHGLLRLTLARLPVEWAIDRVGSFQPTRSARLILALHASRFLRYVRYKMRGCQHSMTIMASASRPFQEPAPSPIPLTEPGPGSAFSARTHAKQRHVRATRGSTHGIRFADCGHAKPRGVRATPVLRHLPDWS